jgi:hypothetical protein
MYIVRVVVADNCISHRPTARKLPCCRDVNLLGNPPHVDVLTDSAPGDSISPCGRIIGNGAGKDAMPRRSRNIVPDFGNAWADYPHHSASEASLSHLATYLVWLGSHPATQPGTEQTGFDCPMCSNCNKCQPSSKLRHSALRTCLWG